MSAFIYYINELSFSSHYTIQPLNIFHVVTMYNTIFEIEKTNEEKQCHKLPKTKQILIAYCILSHMFDKIVIYVPNATGLYLSGFDFFLSGEENF